MPEALRKAIEEAIHQTLECATDRGDWLVYPEGFGEVGLSLRKNGSVVVATVADEEDEEKTVEFAFRVRVTA